MEQVSRRPSKALFKQFNPEGKECLDEWRSTFVSVCDPTEYEAGIQLNDPTLDINWPLPFTVISEKDKTHPMMNRIEPVIL